MSTSSEDRRLGSSCALPLSLASWDVDVNGERVARSSDTGESGIALLDPASWSSDAGTLVSSRGSYVTIATHSCRHIGHEPESAIAESKAQA